ncbi:MAG: aldo/keto reductase [Pseudomonadota bacterium]
MTMIERLWIGTVALGLPYGPSRSMATEQEAFRILDTAIDLGVTAFDTAVAYGIAEDRIGAWIQSKPQPLTICSKLPKARSHNQENGAAWVNQHIAESTRKLGRPPDYYICHVAKDFQFAPIREALMEAVETGRIGATGVSGYAPEDVIPALELPEACALVQMPGSAIDHRYRSHPLTSRIKAQKCRLMLRSLFLQGALLMETSKLPDHLKSGLSPFITRLRQTAEDLGVAVPVLALASVLNSDAPLEAVLGFHSAKEMAFLSDTRLSNSVGPEILANLMEEAKTIDPNLIDPRFWPKID